MCGESLFKFASLRDRCPLATMPFHQIFGPLFNGDGRFSARRPRSVRTLPELMVMRALYPLRAPICMRIVITMSNKKVLSVNPRLQRQIYWSKNGLDLQETRSTLRVSVLRLVGVPQRIRRTPSGPSLVHFCNPPRTRKSTVRSLVIAFCSVLSVVYLTFS